IDFAPVLVHAPLRKDVEQVLGKAGEGLDAFTVETEHMFGSNTRDTEKSVVLIPDTTDGGMRLPHVVLTPLMLGEVGRGSTAVTGESHQSGGVRAGKDRPEPPDVLGEHVKAGQTFLRSAAFGWFGDLRGHRAVTQRRVQLLLPCR